MKTNYSFFICICLFINTTIIAQPGSLDSTFGVNGKVTTSLRTSNCPDYAHSAILQADGKILVAGRSSNCSNNDFGLVRYNSDGTLDNTFGTGGKVITDFGSAIDDCNSVALQPDGKIVAAGCANVSTLDFALIRYNSNGTVDNAFGSSGKVSTDFGGSDDKINTVIVQADGRIVVGGTSSDNSDNNFAMARYSTYGTLDNTFGTGGKVITDFVTNSDYGNSLIMQTDGKLLLAGNNANGSNSSDYVFALVRYNSNGTLDNSFGTNGKVTTDFGVYKDYGNSVAIQADGKIIVGGTVDFVNDYALARYNSNGTLDNTFGLGGKVTSHLVTNRQYYGASVAVQMDGKIILAGNSSANNNKDFSMIRYNSNGSVDSTFGVVGEVFTDFGSIDDMAFSLIIQADGKLFLAGQSNTGTGGVTNVDFAVARYHTTTNTGILENELNSNVSVFPNPYVGSTQINYVLNKRSVVSVDVYNIVGQKVETLVNTTQPVGEYKYSFSAKEKGCDVGVYFVKITMDGKTTMKRILEIR